MLHWPWLVERLVELALLSLKLIQRNNVAGLLDPPSAVLPLLTDITSRVESSQEESSENHDTTLKNDECGLIIGELGTETVSQFSNSEGGADHDEDGCKCEDYFDC
jgi:hypothetical protein